MIKFIKTIPTAVFANTLKDWFLFLLGYQALDVWAITALGVSFVMNIIITPKR